MSASAGKGPGAFRTISEASAELGIPQHVLRFWETKFDFIQPLKRAGGRRFYRPADIEVLRGVRALLHEDGYTIKGVQKLHKDGGMRRLIGAVAAETSPDADAAMHEMPDVVSHGDLNAEALLAAAASPAEPPAERPSRHVLDAAARARLTAVLNDLEEAREAIGALLDPGARR